MNPSTRTTPDHGSLSDLVKKCQDLCGSADSVIPKLAEEDSFLASNLGDALEQLEVILRALGQERGSGESEQEQKSFLKRLFGRTDEDDSESDRPSFYLPRQGLQGNSWTISLSELVGFLAFGCKTGVLWVDSPEENFMVGLVGGRVTHATSDRTPEGLRLGEILVGSGCLTRRQLERFLQQHEGGEDSVSGADLLQSGMISEDELTSALSYQMQQLFQRLINTRNAVFRFREGMQVPLAHQVELDVNQLLLESARATDESYGHGARVSHVYKEWNALRDELASELAPAGESAASAAAEPAPGAEEGRSENGESAPGDTVAGSTPPDGEAEDGEPVSEAKGRKRGRRKHGR